MRKLICLIAAPAVLAGAADNPALGRAETPPPRPVAFAQCAGCHATEPEKTMFGPSLAGVGGRRAGSLPGYAYSQALRDSGLTWNAASLDRWLTSPQRTVPGTRMPFAGIADPTARKAVINYLLALPGSATRAATR